MHLYTREKESIYIFFTILTNVRQLNLTLNFVSFLFLSWRSHQTSGASAELLSSNIALKWLESEFFRRDAE